MIFDSQKCLFGYTKHRKHQKIQVNKGKTQENDIKIYLCTPNCSPMLKKNLMSESLECIKTK